MLLGSGHASPAVECFKRAVAYIPGRAEYWLDLGVALDAAGNRADAVDAFRKGIKDDPLDYRPYKALADLYSRLHEAKESESVVKDFLSVMPQSMVMRLAQ